MITIISGSPRQNSNTGKIAKFYSKILSEKNIEHNLVMLEENNFISNNEQFVQLEQNILKPTTKYIVLSPEYNGSFSGALKLLIDNSNVKETFYYKKVLLTGVATGRAGNLRGLEHLTGVFLHMQMLVHPNRLPISVVHTLLNAEGEFEHEATENTIISQLNEYLKF